MSELMIPTWADVLLRLVYPLLAPVAAIALFYKQYLQKTNLSVTIGDTIWLVQSMQTSARKFQLPCTFINRAMHDAVVQSVEARLISPTGRRYSFRWNAFCKWAEGGAGTVRTSDVLPIPAAANSSHQEIIQFHSLDAIEWECGAYELWIDVWANEDSRTDDPTATRKFQTYLSPSYAEALNTPKPTGPSIINTRILDWLPRSLRERILRGERIEP